ncbi:enoyl-ACP reductase [Streptomyces sp. NPDC060184]|uniref:enoyl-ACP reductase FabI n=1 Tax=Streptomyces sp. NPDC060184 TaxID=3347064 RepID=UPI0036503546
MTEPPPEPAGANEPTEPFEPVEPTGLPALPALLALLAGRRGLVIGVSGENSVGYHCAKNFRRLGAEVAISYRPHRAARGAALAAELGCALHLPLDWEDEQSLTAGFRRVADTWGHLDFVVHTLVHTPPGALGHPLTELPRTAFDDALSTGAYSLVAAARHAAPLLERSDNPRIVTLSSAGDSFTLPNYHVLGITKAALNATMRYLAYELGPRGILCNALSFSLLDTDGAVRALGTANTDRTRELLAGAALTRTALAVDQVTTLIALLAGPWLQNTTGQVITQDGGFSLNYLKAARGGRPRTTAGREPGPPPPDGRGA